MGECNQGCKRGRLASVDASHTLTLPMLRIGGPSPPGGGLRALSLRELEAASRLRAAVLLALDHAAVAGEEAVRLQRDAQRRLILGEGLGDAVAHGAGLA